MIAQAQNILITNEIDTNGTLTIKEALDLCEKANRAYKAVQTYNANARFYEFKEIRG